MTGWDGISTVDDLHALAPEAFACLDRMRACALRADLGERIRSSTAVAAYVDQFNADVASLTAAHRSAALEVLGADLFRFVPATWVIDMAERIDHAWIQLGSVELSDPGREAGETDLGEPADAAELWGAVDAFLPAVARLRALDPIVTEVVRLRGARAHDCRLCRSLRSVGAIEAGADGRTFDAVDRYETSDLDDRLKVALRLVDAIIWEPRSWRDGLAEQVRSTFTPAEAVELVLDVVRNGANKIAVALEADQPHVADGVEYFAIDEAGDLVYGLDRPTVME
jgi:alkylhydroperoxidase family enzyme